MQLIRVLSFLVIVVAVSCNERKEMTVALQPFGSFNRSLTDTVANILQATYDVRIVTLESHVLPASAFINIKTPRYRADVIIQTLKDELPDSIDYIMGMTTEDISFTKRDFFGRIKSPESKYADWGIFGLGYAPGPSSVVSTFRIKNTTKDVWVVRLKKIAVHELGHNLGLDHCESSSRCVMRDAVETITTIDQVEAILCANCKSKL